LVPTIVLTGGPCAGKTTVLASLQAEFFHVALFLPEAATQIFALEQNRPKLEWDDCRHIRLQRNIAAKQAGLEEFGQHIAARRGYRLIVCDRGLGDVLAYPGGRKVVEQSTLIDRYHAILHLESLATAAPELYSNDGNSCRQEDVTTAADLEVRTRQAWSWHPSWHFIRGSDLTGKTRRAMDIVGRLVEEVGQ